MTERVFVIAEAGVNHNGDVALAHRLVDVAADAGADAVKFQTFRSEKLASARAEKAAYQKAQTGAEESQLAMLRRLELSEEAHLALREHGRERGIQFLSTPFDLDSLAFLVDRVEVPRIKLGSGELTNGPLLRAAARTGRPLILSTGMASLEEVRLAVGLVAWTWAGEAGSARPSAFLDALLTSSSSHDLQERLVLLQCTTEYPAPYAEVNLRAMATLRELFGVPVGLSDHTPGIHIATAAVAAGATVLEKHITTDRSLPGPDHAASLEPDELKALVAQVRDVEVALGDGVKVPAPSELGNRRVARKSVVASRDIAAGEIFTEAHLTSKRPEGGLSPMRVWELLGRPASRAYSVDEAIDPTELDEAGGGA